MDLLHRLRLGIANKRRELDTIQLLTRLGDRSLSDLGLTRDEIRPVAKLAAQLAPTGVALAEIVAKARAAEAARIPAPRRAFAALERAADRIAARQRVTEYRPGEIDRLVAEAHKPRDEAVANLLRRVGQGVGAAFLQLVGPLVDRIAASAAYQAIELARIRRREFLRLRAQLQSYSDRELMADLRLVRSEIDDVAADGAQRLVDTIIRTGRGRRTAAWGGEAVGVGQPQG